jgi:hypothetical protein
MSDRSISGQEMERSLSRAEARACELARQGMMRVIEKLAPDGSDQLLLAAVATTGLFCDLASALSAEGAADLADVINRSLAGSGWQLTPMRRN